MIRDDAVALIQLELGMRTDLVDTIITALKGAQVQLEAAPTKPWWLISEVRYRRLTAGEERLPVPDDFIMEADRLALWYVPDASAGSDEETERILVKDDYDVIKQNFLNLEGEEDTTIQSPRCYALVGNYFRFRPIPDDDYLVKLIHYKQDTILTSNVENGWLKYAPFALMGKAGQIVSRAVRDNAATETFIGWEREGRLSLTAETTAREEANTTPQMGGPH